MQLPAFFTKTALSVVLIFSFSSANAQDARYYCTKADEFFNTQNFSQAISNYTLALGIDQNHAYAYNGRGKSYGSQNQFDLAIEDFNKAITLSPDYSDAYANRGFIFSKKNQHDLAIKDYTKAISLTPNFTWAYNSRGNSYTANNQPELAIQDFTKAISLNPEYAYLYVNRGWAYCSMKQADLAIPDFNKALSLNPNYTVAYANRGFAYQQKNQQDLAIADFTKAISLDAKYAWGYSNRGYSYQQKKQYDLAIQDYTKAIGLGTINNWIYSNRGYSYSMKYEFEPALADMSKAISIDPSIARNYISRGYYYNNLGKYELAIADYKTCLEKDPVNVYAHINIISPLARLHRFGEASFYYARYKKNNLTSYIESEGYKFYKSFIEAVVHLSEGKLEEAMESLTTSMDEYGMEIKDETKRAYVDILFLTAYILEKADQVADAKDIYEQSLVIDSRQPDLEEAIGRLDQKTATTRTIDNTGPEITLISPTPIRGFDIESDTGKTQIIGKAKDISGIAEIKINNIPVTKIEEDGLFITNLILKSGSNSLVITATDKSKNTASKTFTVNGITADNKPEAKPDLSLSPGGTPKYYAILIAEKDYDDPAIPDLQNPVKDAKELKTILENNYTFSPANIDTLYNRNREDIMQAIVQRCNSLTANDNLIIFYAGHGIAEKDKFGDVDGYWIPSSGKKNLNASYISADDINKAIKRSDAKHILIIADACFSGAFTRSLPADASKDIKKQYGVSSRKVMASGNLEPVPDNSKFIYYLKKKLHENTEKYLTAKDLFDSFYKAILSNSDNLPQYAAIKNTGDEGGEFIFIKK